MGNGRLPKATCVGILQVVHPDTLSMREANEESEEPTCTASHQRVTTGLPKLVGWFSRVHL